MSATSDKQTADEAIAGVMKIIFKSQLRAKKADWRTLAVEKVLDHVSDLPPKDLKSGYDAVYLSPVVTDEKGQTYYWLILDVEDQENHHNSIQANIKAAQSLLVWLQEKGLEKGLVVILTGSGFRFVWPLLVPAKFSRGFLTWIKDRESFPMIDPAPQQNKTPMRVLGYRGHPRQNNSPRSTRDVHTHVLPDPSHLHTMTEDEYLRLVRGKLPAPILLHWLPRLLPQFFVPKPWINLFEGYEREARLKDSIFEVRFPVRPQGINWSMIWDQLAAAGIEARETQRADIIIWKLSECPSCGRRGGNPYLTSSGRIKCFHANSCEAGQKDEEGRPIGLHPSKWVPEYQGRGERPPQDHGTLLTVDAAREIIFRAVQGGCNGNQDLLIRATPGVGKTHTTLMGILEDLPGVVVYAAPTTELSKEAYDLAIEIAPEKADSIYLLQGRNEDNCPFLSELAGYSERGFSPKFLYCLPKCPFYKTPCAYFAQVKNTKGSALFFTTHARSRILLPPKTCTIIVDEDPTNTFIQSNVVSEAALTTCRLGLSKLGLIALDKITQFSRKLFDALSATKGSQTNKHARAYGTRPPEGSQWCNTSDLWTQAEVKTEEKQALLKGLAVWHPLISDATGKEETLPVWQQRLWDSKINLNALRWLWAALGDEPGVAYLRVSRFGEPFTYCLTRRILPPGFTGRYIVLDGTGNLSAMNSLFQRDFHKVEAETLLPDCHKIFFQRALGKTKASKLTEKQIKSLLRRAFEHLRMTDKKILVATHQDIEEKVLKTARALLPGREIDSTHFWASKGVNKWEDLSAVIAFGTPTANQASVLDKAMMLFCEQEDWENWIASLGRKDLVQTIHRIRPIKGGKTIVIMGREWPQVLGQADMHLSMRKGEQKQLKIARARLRDFVEVHGFITKEIGWALGVGCNREKQKIRDFRNQLEKAQSYLLDKMQPQTPGSMVAFHLILKILIKQNATSKGGVSLPKTILFGNASSWNNLLSLLKQDFPSLPDLKSKREVYGGRWSVGLGSLTAARLFYIRAELNFHEPLWEGIEVKHAMGSVVEPHALPHHQLHSCYQPPSPCLPGMPNHFWPHAKRDVQVFLAQAALGS